LSTPSFHGKKNIYINRTIDKASYGDNTSDIRNAVNGRKHNFQVSVSLAIKVLNFHFSSVADKLPNL
jgi:hypothetical protein